MKYFCSGLVIMSVGLLLGGCNSGGYQSNNINSFVATSQEVSGSGLLTSKLYSPIETSNTSVDNGINCLSSNLEQYQSNGKLYTTMSINNKCDYDIFIGGNNVLFSSEYLDGTLAKIESLNYSFLSNGSYKNYTLLLNESEILCSGNNKEILLGKFNARKIKSNTVFKLSGITNITKPYNIKLAKASFSMSGLKNGILLTDPESYNYAKTESGNIGRDSLTNIPLNQFGLKTIMITNNSCTDVESVMPTINLPEKLSIDRIRTTCKLDGMQYLNKEQSCNYVVRYDPKVTDINQETESSLSIDVYSKVKSSNIFIKSESFITPYSTRGKILPQELIKDKLILSDNKITTNGLSSISIGYFGLQSFTLKNNSSAIIESINFSGLYSEIIIDTTRGNCKINGTQQLSPNQSCTVVLKYLPKIQQVNDIAILKIVGYERGSKVKKYLVQANIPYSTAINNTISLIESNNFFNGFNVDESPTVSFKSSLDNIPIGSFGLKAFTITNDTGETIYNLNIKFNDILSSGLIIDDTRSSCKIKLNSEQNKFTLKEDQGCTLVFKYSPLVKNELINSNFVIRGSNSANNLIQSKTIKLVGYSRK